MIPIKFEEQTVIIAENQDEYLSLPAHQFNDQEGRIAFCWKLTWRERWKILFSGTIWQQVYTFNQPLQPQLLEVDKPDMVGTHEIK